MIALFILFLWISALSATVLVLLINFVKIHRRIQGLEGQIDLNIENKSNMILARFQKITTTKLKVMDDKIEILNQLIKDADEIYSKSLSILSDLENAYEKVKRRISETSVNNEQFKNKKSEKEIKESIEVKRNEKVENVENKGEIFEKKREKIEKIEKKESSVEDEQDIIRKEILRLYNEGFSPTDIAKKLDIGVGEVLLIINLYTKG